MRVFIDFDGTITHSDTIDALAESAIGITGKPESFYKDEWPKIVKAWEDDFKAYKDKHPFPVKRPSQDLLPSENLEKEQLKQEMLVWLEGLRVVEEASVQRVNASRMFEGAGALKLTEAGEIATEEGKVKLRRRFSEFVGRVTQTSSGTTPTIVSVNWSSNWIKGCIGEAVRWEIVSNAIDPYSGKIVSSWTRHHPILTGGDKYQAVLSILETAGDFSFLYIGDSLTDLTCLTRCTRGIVMTVKPNGNEVYQALVDLGHSVPHISEDNATGSRFAWARDFDEIPTKLLEH